MKCHYNTYNEMLLNLFNINFIRFLLKKNLKVNIILIICQSYRQLKQNLIYFNITYKKIYSLGEIGRHDRLKIYS